MATITRTEAIEQIQAVLKSYENKIRDIRYNTEKLPPEGKNIVDSYCCNEENEQVLVRNAYSDKKFFQEMTDKEIIQYHKICRELNQYLELGINNMNSTITTLDNDSVICTQHSYDGAIDVAKYIVEEIKKNIKSKEALEIYDYLHYEKYIEKYYNSTRFTPPPDPLTIKSIGIAKWFEMVNTGKPWDHKPKIASLFKYCAVKRYTQKGNLSESHFHKYKYYDYFYDVWSNIHYGFLGRFCGFSEDFLHFGSGVQQFASNLLNFKFSADDIADKITMQLGMNLYAEFKNNISNLSYTIILENLDALPSIGESRQIHKCFDKQQTGIKLHE